MRFLIVVALFEAAMYGNDDITIPLDGGSIIISDIQLTLPATTNNNDWKPDITFKVKNQTSSTWQILKFRFDVKGLCKVRQLMYPVDQVHEEHRQWVIPSVLVRNVVSVTIFNWGWTGDVCPVNNPVGLCHIDGCKGEIIKADLLFAESSKTRIDMITGERVDLEKQRQELKAKSDAEESAQAKRDAAEAARRQRAVSERKRKQAEDDAEYAKYKASEDAKKAEEQRT